MTGPASRRMPVHHEKPSVWSRRSTNYALLTLQGLLAALFLFAGGIKLVLPVEEMTKQMAMPGWFLRFIGVAEVCGAVGILLPWLLGIRRELTPLAACCLLIIMIGATVVTILSIGIAPAMLPAITGICLVVVAYGRWQALRH